MEQLAASQTFRCILATVLAIGNFLNGCKVSDPSLYSFDFLVSHFSFPPNSHNTFYCAKARGFELSYLGKLSYVRDTHTRQPLLHHVCVLLLQLYPQSSDLYSDITAVTKAGKVRVFVSERCVLHCSLRKDYLDIIQFQIDNKVCQFIQNDSITQSPVTLLQTFRLFLFFTVRLLPSPVQPHSAGGPVQSIMGAAKNFGQGRRQEERRKVGEEERRRK